MRPQAAPDYPGILAGLRLAQAEADLAARIEATMAVAQGILADPQWTARVVVAAIVAQDIMGDRGPAWDVLWDDTRDRSRVVR